MKSPRVYSDSRGTHQLASLRAKYARGFSLIEVLVVVGILAGIAAMTIMMGLNSVGRSVATEDRDLLVTLLNDARAQALANVNEMRHGVHIAADGSSYTVFEVEEPDFLFVDSDPSSHRTVPRAAGVGITPLGSDVVFDQLSGDAVTGDSTITLSKDTLTIEIDIDSAGRIDW